MRSNTKLTTQQKMDRKLMLAQFTADGGTIGAEAPMVVVFMPTGSNTAEIATAMASPEEKKFRRKVGEYHALTRFYDRQVSVVSGHTSAADLAYELGSGALTGDWFDSFGNIKK